MKIAEKEIENTQEKSDSRLSSVEQRIVTYDKYSFY